MNIGVQQEDLRSRLQSMEASGFRDIIAELWEQQDWQTETSYEDGPLVKASRGAGISSETIAVKPRCLSEGYKVQSPDIEEYAKLPAKTNVDSVTVVTTTEFTKDAREAAQTYGMKLVNGDDLISLINDLDAENLLDSSTSSGSDGIEVGSSTPNFSEREKTTLGKLALAIFICGGNGAIAFNFVSLGLPSWFAGPSGWAVIIWGLGMFYLPYYVFKDARAAQSSDSERSPSAGFWAFATFFTIGFAALYYCFKRIIN